MVKQARPAVVRITSTAGTGTGVIFDTQGRTGYVVTNEHVVEATIAGECDGKRFDDL